jgi:hypothetical protein
VQSDSSPSESPVDFCERKISHFKEKADHNKAEALRCFIGTIACTLSTPLFVTLGSGLWVGKIIPSVLSLLAAAATAWLQLRKPQQLWSLYRTTQRELEDRQVRYRYLVGEFRDVADPDKLLAENVADIALAAHQQWALLVPTPERIKALAAGSSPVSEEPASSKKSR